MFHKTASYAGKRTAEPVLAGLRVDIVDHLLSTAKTMDDWNRAVTVAQRFQIPLSYFDFASIGGRCAANENSAVGRPNGVSREQSRKRPTGVQSRRFVSGSSIHEDDDLSSVGRQLVDSALDYLVSWVQPFVSAKVSHDVVDRMQTSLTLHLQGIPGAPVETASSGNQWLSFFSHCRWTCVHLQAELISISILHRLLIAEISAEEAMAEIAERLLPFSTVKGALIQSMIRCVGSSDAVYSSLHWGTNYGSAIL